MLDKLEKHHLGIVVSPGQIQALEDRWGVGFHWDTIQGVRVLFRWNHEMNLHEEYIGQEGRAQNYPLGFHHICYNVPDMATMNTIHQNFLNQRSGFRLTFPEKSGSSECQTVCFYKINHQGIIEFNILDKSLLL